MSKDTGTSEIQECFPSKAIEGILVLLNNSLILIHCWYNCLSGRPLLEGEGWDYFSWWRHFQGGENMWGCQDPELSNFLPCTGEGQRNFLLLTFTWLRLLPALLKSPAWGALGDHQSARILQLDLQCWDSRIARLYSALSR